MRGSKGRIADDFIVITALAPGDAWFGVCKSGMKTRAEFAIIGMGGGKRSGLRFLPYRRGTRHRIHAVHVDDRQQGNGKQETEKK